jgi:hypothetical protein
MLAIDSIYLPAFRATGWFDDLLTLCYIELPRGKFSAAMLFVRSANLWFTKSLDRLREAT